MLTRPIALPLDVDSVLGGQGLRPSEVRQHAAALVRAAETALEEGRPLLAPQVTSRTLAFGEFRKRGFAGSRGLLHRLQGAEEIVLAVCTIGGALEQHAAARIRENLAVGLALDGLGTAAVEALAAEMCADITGRAKERGLLATGRIGPGADDWSLEEGQPALFDIVDAQKIGVRLSASLQMQPCKSLSFVMGIGKAVSIESAGRCDHCGARGRCRWQPAGSAQ